MTTYNVIVPIGNNQPGISKPDICALTLAQAKTEAKKLYGKGIIVFEAEYDPFWFEKENN